MNTEVIQSAFEYQDFLNSFNLFDRLYRHWKRVFIMKVSPQIKGINFIDKSSKSTTPTAKKYPSQNTVLESQKTTERIYTKMADKSSDVLQQKTKKSKFPQPNIPQSNRRGEKRDSKENEDKQFNQEMSRLKAEMQTLRRNHKQEIEFYLSEELNMAMNVEKLLVSKQYRRLFIYIQHQIYEMKKRLDDFHASDEEQISRHKLHEDLYLESEISEDIELRSLTEHLQENIQELGIQNVTILPQIQKLMSETELSVKKLSWYFSKLPFDLPSKEVCMTLASKIVDDLGCNTGSQVMEIIVSKAKTQSQAVKQPVSSDSSISKIIQRHSLCIL